MQERLPQAAPPIAGSPPKRGFFGLSRGRARVAIGMPLLALGYAVFISAMLAGYVLLQGSTTAWLAFVALCFFAWFVFSKLFVGRMVDGRQ